MKKPTIPPSLGEKEALSFKVMHRFRTDSEVMATYQGEYLYWDELRYKQPRPEGLTAKEWWFVTKFHRRSLKPYQLPFQNINDKSFNFIVPNILQPKLATIDRKSGGFSLNSALYSQDTYIVSSLIEESISSSQLEGASTTRRVAKDMLLSQRKPRNESERMIANNYLAMKFIQENKSRELSIEFILDIHRILMEDILEDAGSLRIKDDVEVVDPEGEILHTPPKAKELKKRLKILCDFASQDETEEQHYIHSIIKGILLHFMLAYDHPFSDGNGRTARAIFYWFMLNRGYWLIEYISISKIIKQAPVQYGQAFLYTETDDNDVTYFIFHQVKVILKAIDALYSYLDKKTEEIQKVSALLHDDKNLNYRQLALIQHALKHPETHYLIEHHRQAHNITYQTARTDLLKLEEQEFLSKRQVGKTFVFIASQDLKKRIGK